MAARAAAGLRYVPSIRSSAELCAGTCAAFVTVACHGSPFTVSVIAWTVIASVLSFATTPVSVIWYVPAAKVTPVASFGENCAWVRLTVGTAPWGQGTVPTVTGGGAPRGVGSAARPRAAA